MNTMLLIQNILHVKHHDDTLHIADSAKKTLYHTILYNYNLTGKENGTS